MIPPWFDEYSSLKLSAELPKTPQPAREAQRSFQQPECAAFKIWESQRDGNVRKEATLASGLGCWILMTRIAKKRYHYSFRNQDSRSPILRSRARSLGADELLEGRDGLSLFVEGVGLGGCLESWQVQLEISTLGAQFG